MKNSTSTSPVTNKKAAAETTADAKFLALEQIAYLKSVATNLSAAMNDDTALLEVAEPVPTANERTPARKSVLAKLADMAATRQWPQPSVILKSCLAIAIAAVLGWMPVQRLFATTSAEAIVNARVVTLRAPIEGEVQLTNANSEIGTEFSDGQIVLTISNPRADGVRLGDLQRDRERTRTALNALASKKEVLRASLTELAAQEQRFRVGRTSQLEQRVREADTNIAAAAAQVVVASQALSRAQSLRSTGVVSQSFLDKAVRDEGVAKENNMGLIERRKGMLVELSSAKNGTFIGDSYNDTPQSAQRKMEVELELADVGARLEGSEAELTSIESAIAEEAQRQQKLSKAIVRSTVNGRIWELLTAPGEHVNAGQDLLKVIDCGSAIVTASVSETAFQRLSIGQRATFRRRDDGSLLQGWIVGLNGLAAVASNSAIQQSALTREPYHVTLKFPDLTRAAECQIGRAGLVQFDMASTPVNSAMR